MNDLVRLLGLAQPQVSKHLRVLREVGAVDVRDEGRQRLYRLNGHALKPIHDWVKNYEHSWSERFERLDLVLEELKQHEYVSPVASGFILVALGEKERGYARLLEGCAERTWTVRAVKVHPIYDFMRSDPGYKSLLRCLNLE